MPPPSPSSRSHAPIPVLLVIRHMNVGGAQRQLFHLACGLDRARFEPIVVCLHREEPLMAALRERGIETHCVPARRSVDLSLPLRLARLARRRRAAILHAHLFAANAWGRLAARLAGVPVAIASERTDQAMRRRREIAVERLLAPWTHAYVVNSDAVGRRVLQDVPAMAGRVHRIYNGVDLTPFDAPRAAARASLRSELGLGEDDRLVALVGTLSPDKAHRIALEALRSLRPEEPRLHLLIVGDGDERGTIRDAIASLELGDRAHLLGQRSDVAAVLRGCDMLLQSSLREGMPNAVLEGMAAALPIVATRVGGTEEALENGLCGDLVPPGDPAQLARAMRRLLSEPDRARELGARARRRVETTFSVTAMVQETQRLYESLLHRERAAPLESGSRDRDSSG